jgi:hypothetical protein
MIAHADPPPDQVAVVRMRRGLRTDLDVDDHLGPGEISLDHTSVWGYGIDPSSDTNHNPTGIRVGTRFRPDLVLSGMVGEGQPARAGLASRRAMAGAAPGRSVAA